jgi:hypothetical protein
MKTLIYLSLATLAFLVTPAKADFQRWSAEVESDPFTGGNNVSATYLMSVRSGAFIECDSATHELTFKVVAGWEYETSIADYVPTIDIAIDGKIFGSYEGKTGAYGSNIAGVFFKLSGEKAVDLLRAIAGSQKQIAVRDGISDGPHLMSAKGSTAAGKKLLSCIGE